MNVLLVNSPIDDYSIHKPQEYETVVPVGLGYIGTVLRKDGHNVNLIDSEVDRLTFDQVSKKINSFSPQILGINAPMPDISIVKRILDNVSKDIYVVVGGTQATLEPKRTFTTLNPDALVVGEGEDTIIELINNLETNSEIKSQKGLYLKGYQGEIFERNDFISDLDKFPFLDRTLFKNDPYKTEVGLEATMLSSRGCPYDCVFCSVPKVSGKLFRKRSIDNVIEEMESLKNEYNVQSVRFIDDNFTLNKRRVLELSNKLIESKLNMNWRALSRIEAIRPEILEKMAESGCYKLAFGIENFSPNVQKLIHKEIKLEKIRENLDLCKELGIKTKGFFTLGYPGETPEMIQETINLSQKLPLDDVNYNIVRAFEGTRLIEIAQEKGFNKKELSSFHQFETLENFRGFNKKTIKKAKALIEAGFNINKYLKYHFSNGVVLNRMNINDLDLVIRKAYIDFYYSRIIK